MASRPDGISPENFFLLNESRSIFYSRVGRNDNHDNSDDKSYRTLNSKSGMVLIGESSGWNSRTLLTSVLTPPGQFGSRSFEQPPTGADRRGPVEKHVQSRPRRCVRDFVTRIHTDPVLVELFSQSARANSLDWSWRQAWPLTWGAASEHIGAVNKVPFI